MVEYGTVVSLCVIDIAYYCGLLLYHTPDVGAGSACTVSIDTHACMWVSLIEGYIESLFKCFCEHILYYCTHY